MDSNVLHKKKKKKKVRPTTCSNGGKSVGPYIHLQVTLAQLIFLFTYSSYQI